MDTLGEATQVGTGKGKKLRRTIKEKRDIVEETLVVGASVARVARRHGVNASDEREFVPKLRVGSFHRSDSEGCTIVTIERHSSDRLSAGPLHMRAPRAPGSSS